MQVKKQVILGSASPRRRELLHQIGLEFTIIKSDCEEKITSSIPEEVVKELSLQKAEDVFSKIGSGAYSAMDKKDVLVIGSDTVVAIEDEILGKPLDREDAVSMLKRLQGRVHQVYTSVSFLWEEQDQVQTHTFYEVTDVEVLPMTEEEIAYYVNLNTCMDKAGAYGIQNEFACFVKGIRGDYNTVVGLPVGRVYQELKQLHFLEF